MRAGPSGCRRVQYSEVGSADASTVISVLRILPMEHGVLLVIKSDGAASAPLPLPGVRYMHATTSTACAFVLRNSSPLNGLQMLDIS